jgi:hypothetical protein
MGLRECIDGSPRLSTSRATRKRFWPRRRIGVTVAGMERTSIGSRLFNTIVVLGMGLSANACSTSTVADTGTTGDTGSNADTASATDSATDTGTTVADAADAVMPPADATQDTMAGWACCA